jgi:AsmA protein
MLASGEGTVTANFGEGNIQKLDMAAFLGRLAKGDFFALDEVASGSLAVKGVVVKAAVSKGIVRITKAEIRAANATISASGIIPSVGGLALSGSIASGDGTTASSQTATFFVGGSWSKPIVIPAASASTSAD